MDTKSDCSDWYFTGNIIFRRNNFKEIRRSNAGRGTELLKKINEYKGRNCYIPTDGNCFIKCVNHVLKKDLKNKFQTFINTFPKANRKGVMTSARINKFNEKCNTSFQIYTPENRNLRPREVNNELDWVLYLHNSHFCLIRRNQKSLGIKEIEDNYEQVWKTCRDDNAVKQVSPLKLNVFPNMSDDTLFAWDCETYSESETRKAIPYSCTLLNLEKLRKKLEMIQNNFPNLNPTDNIPEAFYNKLMNIVEIFVGTDCIDQMLKYLGQYDKKRLTLVSHNGSGFDNWIIIKNVKKLTQCPLITPRGILSLPLSNPYTDEDLQKRWKRQKDIKGNSNYLQHINFTCSYQHEVSSLAAWGKSSNLPMILRKIADGWYYLYHYDKEMVEETYYESTRLVPKHTEKQNIEKVYSHTNPFIRHFIRRSIKGGRVSANRKIFTTDKLNEICNVLKEYTQSGQSEYTQSDDENIIDLFKEYSKSDKDKTEVNSKLKNIKCSKLMAFDANGLYASAMSDLDSEYPKAESGRPFLPEEEEEFVRLFNEQNFRPKTAILTVWFEYPKNMFFQPIPSKDKISFKNKEGKNETGTKIRFRNGFCYDVLTSVDIQEIVKAGGRIIRILDGIVYEQNFRTPPYRDYILILRDLRNQFKRDGNIVGSNCMKLLGNALYGKSIQKDISSSKHLWSEVTLKANFDSHVKHYEKINDTQYIVDIEEEEKEIEAPKSTTRLTPSHLGSFVLSHSKKIMNNFIHVIDGFYQPEIYYTDTDSLYISSSNWDKLNEAGLVSENEYCKGKNDYGDGGIIFG
ncbi:hypothetical protein LOTGIDRAFT_155884 [Lottia gigantea]|uniref:DNA-directed DNA polymerase n=1 Tax=Lottia gigantea TaxID=225164 RepID=V3YXR5_LOTGI|nr:hypothetical protein LOTGIDRAFT_155884 [Lottia gigantea]ESO82848.1 hypothetical protein LOTGIDRAFT_155884 [Lottia gigantea]